MSDSDLNEFIDSVTARALVILMRQKGLVRWSIDRDEINNLEHGLMLDVSDTGVEIHCSLPETMMEAGAEAVFDGTVTHVRDL